MQTPRAHITPNVLHWARQRAFFDVDQAARKAGVQPEVYEAWEEGAGRLPTMRQAEKLADAFLLPLGVFFRDEPPAMPDPIPAMRRLPGATGRPDPALVKQIRLAHGRRQLALDLINELDEEAPEFPYSTDLNETPSAVATRIRVLLSAGPEVWESWRDEWTALNWWRDAVERLGVLVFQVSLPLQDMRGFALAERPLPVVAINSKDSPYGRIFTLLHELVHVLLGESTLEDGGLGAFNDATAVEEFCNRVAAEVLLPKDLLMTDETVYDLGHDGYWTMLALTRVSRRYKVSDVVLLRRLRELGLVSREAFDHLYERVVGRQYSPKTGGGDPYVTAIKQVGLPLLRLAFASAYQNRLSAHSLSKIAGLGVPHLGELEQRVQGSSLMFAGHE